MAGQPAPSDVCREFFEPGTGPLHRLARRAGLSGPQALVWAGMALGVVAWLPLFVLTALNGTVTAGASVPFEGSFGTHVRLLVAIPLYFAAERLFDHRARAAVAKLVEGRVIPREEHGRFGDLLRQVTRWLGGWGPEILALVVTALFLWEGVRTDLPARLTTWRVDGTERLTPAGIWYTFVSFPLFQFVLWRSVARVGIWTQLLWRMARLRLNLVPTHPDGAGGLGVLGVVQTAMTPFCFATSAVVVASLAERLRHGGAQIEQTVMPLLGLALAVTAVVVIPLAGFGWVLLTARQEGLLAYGELASEYVAAFHRKWIERDPPPKDPMVEAVDFSALADLAGAYAVVERMRLVPMTRLQILSLVGAALLPMVPLVLFVTPFDELILRTLRSILLV